MTVKNLPNHLGAQLPAPRDLLHWLEPQQRRTSTDGPLGLLGTFALGTLVGSALALLFAPRRGDDLRRELGERLEQATQRLTERLKRSEVIDAAPAAGPGGRTYDEPTQ
jgi:hypothetical protein